MNIIKQLNKHLLENYPILWNLRIPHLLILLVPALIIFFIFGFLCCDLDSHYWSVYSSLSSTFYFLFSISVLGSIVMFILWLVKYNNNNSVDNFYPRSTLSVYLEWVGVVLITFLFMCIPFAMFCGANTRVTLERNKLSNLDQKELVIMGNMLLPSDSTQYILDEDQKALIIEPNSDISKIPAEEMQHTSNGLLYTGQSLLYYERGYTSMSISDHEMEAAILKMKSLLKKQDADGVRKVMKEYLQYCKSNNIDADLSVNTWFNMVYNPPYYPVNSDNMITESNYYYDDNEYSDRPYVNKYSAESYLYDNYDSLRLLDWLPYILYASIGLSLYIFSYRFSKGTNILFAFVFLIAVWFAGGIASMFFAFLMISSFSFYYTFWLLPMIAVWGLLLYKVHNNLPKKFSKVYFHIGIWFLPFIFPYISLFLLREDIFDSGVILFVNLVVTFALMYPASVFSVKWKSLPEE